MEYNINGAKIKVIRKEDDKGITILDAIVHSFIIDKNRPKGDELKNEDKPKPKK